MIFRYLIGLCILLAACNSPTEQTSPTVDNQPTKTVGTKTTTKKTILFFGNSLSAGYGVKPEECFVGLIQKKVDSLQLPYQVINAGVSGETTAGGNARIDWVLRQKVDVFVLELGGNDGLRGINITTSYNNLSAIIEKVKKKYPEAKIVLAGMQAPPNMGEEFTSDFRAIYPKLAKVHNITLMPFLLKGVGGVPSLNQRDGIHPNVIGHAIVSQNIWEIIKPLL